VQTFGLAFFNVDDRCAELSGGSYYAIPNEIRIQAQRECERFVSDCTTQGTSFAVETTLRSRRHRPGRARANRRFRERLVRIYSAQRITFDEPPVPSWLATIVSGG